MDEMSIDELERETEELGDAIEAIEKRLSAMEARVDKVLTRLHMAQLEQKDGGR